jgi:hypothetical protein
MAAHEQGTPNEENRTGDKQTGTNGRAGVEQCLAECMRTPTENKRPNNPPGRIGHEKSPPIHAVETREQSGQHPQIRNEASEEHDLAACRIKMYWPSLILASVSPT